MTLQLFLSYGETKKVLWKEKKKGLTGAETTTSY